MYGNHDIVAVEVFLAGITVFDTYQISIFQGSILTVKHGEVHILLVLVLIAVRKARLATLVLGIETYSIASGNINDV